MVQVLYLLEVFILAHYGPPSTETPTTTIVRCHKNSCIYLTSTYLQLVTFETNDNYSIRFEISNNSSTIRFDSKWKKHYSHSTNNQISHLDASITSCLSFTNACITFHLSCSRHAEGTQVSLQQQLSIFTRLHTLIMQHQWLCRYGNEATSYIHCSKMNHKPRNPV